MNEAALLLDVAVLALLVATLVRAVRLERALHVLRSERGAWEIAVGGLGAGTRDAQAGLADLHAAADGVAREVATQVGRAGGLKDDLTFLLERAEAACDRLEHAVRASRPAYVAEPTEEPALPDRHASDRHVSGPQSLEQDLLAALRRMR